MFQREILNSDDPFLNMFVNMLINMTYTRGWFFFRGWRGNCTYDYDNS